MVKNDFENVMRGQGAKALSIALGKSIQKTVLAQLDHFRVKADVGSVVTSARFRRLYHSQRIRQQFRIASDDQRRVILDIANLPSSLERRIVDELRIVF